MRIFVDSTFFAMEPEQKRMKMDSQKRGILELPNEVMELIFLMLSQHDIQQNVALVCRRFLEITRKPNFLETVEIELIPEENGSRNLARSCIEKIEKVLKIYPGCNLELFQAPDEMRGTAHSKNDIVGYSWLKEFVPFASSIIELKVESMHEDSKDFSEFILLENLRCLDLDVSYTDTHGGESIQDEEAEFWNKFPNLKYLRIKSDYEQCCVSCLKQVLICCIFSDCFTICSQLMTL